MIQHTLLKPIGLISPQRKFINLLKNIQKLFPENALIQNKMIEDWAKRQTSSTVRRKLSLFKSLNTEVIFQEMTKMNLKYLTYFDKHYPQLLKEIYDFPYVIFIKEINNYLIVLIL